MPKQKQAPGKQGRGKRPAIIRQRLSPELRRMQIMDAAAALIVKQGFLPLPIERLAHDAGASKALIYTYFPTQYQLFNALLQRELNGLAVAGLDTAASVEDLDQAVLLCAMLYFEHVAQYGPLLHILITDLYMAGHVDVKVVAAGEAILQRLSRLARETLPLSNKEIAASIEMMAAIPEEAGSLTFHKEVDAAIARQICHTLTLSSLKALRSPDEGVAAAGDGA